MSSVAMTGADTFSINGIPIQDLADGNCVELNFPNDVSNLKTGKDGNSIYAFNAAGLNCEAKMRIVRGSKADKLLNGLLVQQNKSYDTFPLMFGEFVKKINDGTGTITSDIYVLTGGTFKTNVDGKSNVDGDTDQSVAMYSFKFASAQRALT